MSELLDIINDWIESRGLRGKVSLWVDKMGHGISCIRLAYRPDRKGTRSAFPIRDNAKYKGDREALMQLLNRRYAKFGAGEG